MTNTECVKPVCTKREIITPKGEYEACPEHTKPDASCKICESTICEFPNQIVLPDGNCSNCTDYTHPSTDGKSCVVCGGITVGVNDIVKKDGTCCDCGLEVGEDGACEEAGGFGYVADANNRVCNVCTPAPGEILTKEGNCVPCERYFGANVQQRECVQCDPKEFEIIKEDGTCEACPIGEICGQMEPGPLKHTCKCADCPSDEYYLDVTLNKCIVCDEFFHAGPDGTNCTRCLDPTDLEIVNVNGDCEQCPAGTHPAPLLENCDAAEGEICFPTKCMKDPTCPPWTVYDKDGYCIIECPAH